MAQPTWLETHTVFRPLSQGIITVSITSPSSNVNKICKLLWVSGSMRRFLCKAKTDDGKNQRTFYWLNSQQALQYIAKLTSQLHKQESSFFTFFVPSDAVRISFRDNALKSAWTLNIFLKSLFKPIGWQINWSTESLMERIKIILYFSK